ncbi:MAG: peptidylprolyl isomerase [Candidatus Omnitrophota bacterium]
MILRLLKTLPVCLLLMSSFTAVQAEVVDKVLVVVNDEVLTQRDLDKVFVPLKQRYESTFSGEELKERLKEAETGMLEQMINSKLAVSLAKKSKIEIDEKELQKKIEKIRSYYKTEEEFLQALSAKGMTLSDFKSEIRDGMLAQNFIDKEVGSKVTIFPTEVEELYQKNKEKLVSPKKVKVREIMIRKKGEPDETDARKKTEDILSDIKNGKDFANLAAQYSEGPYARNGGDMGYITTGQVLEEIEDAVFKLNEGDVSDIVETSIGYHLFLVEHMQEEYLLPFEEARSYLEQQLYMKKFEEQMIKWLEDKRKNAYIDYKH